MSKRILELEFKSDSPITSKATKYSLEITARLKVTLSEITSYKK